MQCRHAVAVAVASSLLLLCETGISQKSPGSAPEKPRAKVISLQSQESYMPILSGPPGSVRMRSGMVALASGKSVGKHSTHDYEELLIVLEGKGEMTFADGSKLPVEANSAVYCPPNTDHDVTNTGTALLRYVYVASKAQ